MDNFTFVNPTKIIFGPGSVEEAGRETGRLGATALVVHGRQHAEKSGLLGRVRKLLEDDGVEVFTLGGIDPNPRIGPCVEGIHMCQEMGVDAVVGLGGGSVMDTAKAVAAGTFYEGEPWDMTKHGQDPYEPPTKSLPTVMIPTLAATGSEMNCNAVITNPETKEKCAISHPCLYPRVSIVDPALTCSAPAKQTAYGAMDTIAHVIEAYLNGGEDTPLQDRMQEGVMLTVMEEAPKALKTPDDLAARSNLQWASVVALNGWAQAGCPRLFPMHWIEHVISAHYDVAHGAGLAIIVPAWMKVAYRTRPAKYAQFAERLFGVRREGRSEEAAALEGIERFEQFIRGMGNPTRLKDVGVGTEKFELMSREVLRISARADGKLPGRPPLDQAGVRKVFETAA